MFACVCVCVCVCLCVCVGMCVCVRVFAFTAREGRGQTAVPKGRAFAARDKVRSNEKYVKGRFPVHGHIAKLRGGGN
jgi:hypothetical protein